MSEALETIDAVSLDLFGLIGFLNILGAADIDKLKEDDLSSAAWFFSRHLEETKERFDSMKLPKEVFDDIKLP